MRIAVLGDIHGNLPALEAVYDRALTERVESMYHLGDLGGYAPFVNQVVDFLNDHGIVGVQGNYDETVANDREHCGCTYEDPLQAEMAAKGFEWTKRTATGKSKAYLRSLPKRLTITVHGRTVSLFHATPSKNNLYWHADRPEKFFLDMAEKDPADVLVFGHTHIPFRKDIVGKVFINAGSVGKPKDGDPRACLTIVDAGPEGVAVDFVRVAYDVERTAKAIIERGLPGYFAERLREGR